MCLSRLWLKRVSIMMKKNALPYFLYIFIWSKGQLAWIWKCSRNHPFIYWVWICDKCLSFFYFEKPNNFFKRCLMDFSGKKQKLRLHSVWQTCRGRSCPHKTSAKRVLSINPALFTFLFTNVRSFSLAFVGISNIYWPVTATCWSVE